MKPKTLVLASLVGAGTAAGVSVALAHALTDVQDNPGNRPIDATPGDFGLPFEDVTFPAAIDRLTISGWLIPCADSETAVVMIPGGGLNRLNGDAAATLQIAAMLREQGHNVLLYDPRGTGRSDFARCSYGSFEKRDLLGALALIESRGWRADRTGVLAWSMGAATAMLALESVAFGAFAADSPLGRMSHKTVAMNIRRATSWSGPVADVIAMAVRSGGFLATRALWGMDLHRDPTAVLRSHPIPTMVIYGTADSQLPAESAREVAAAAGDSLVAAHAIDDVAHIGAYSRSPHWYLRTVGDFFRTTLQER
jgi:pimeloyl-ACP methyl ester carboxylesterase